VRSSLSDTSEASLIKFSNFVAVVPAHANTDRSADRVAGGVDMSFWIWVGVAIVGVLLVEFVRDRRRAASRRATREVTLNVASKGETLSAICTRASSGEAAAVVGDPSSVSATTTSFGKPRRGCQPEHQPPLALGVPVGGEKVRVVPTVR